MKINTIITFLRQNKLFTCATVITLFLAYGFYASHYSIHIDQLVSEYYNGSLLIGAGRWTAPLIHLFTGWMDFAPFWHTVVMALLLMFAAAEWAILFFNESGCRISKGALTAFSTVFVSFPLLKAQLTYPVLNIALAYLLVPVVLQLLLQGFDEKCKRIKSWIPAAVFLMTAVDLYESFAGVFLVGFFAVLLLRYHSENNPRKFIYYFRLVLCAVVLLAAAVAMDFLISKLICLIVKGSTEYWYTSNSTIQWFESPFMRNLKRLISTLFAVFVIGGSSVPALAFVLLLILAGSVVAIIMSVKRRSAVLLLIWFGMCCSVFALPILIGRTIPFTQMQAFPLFAAASVMLIFQLCSGKKVLNGVMSVLLVVIVFSQTKDINNYAVDNYERYQYESSILDDAGKELLSYDIQHKPVVFLANDYELPGSLRSSRHEPNPFEEANFKAFTSILDRVLPESYFLRMQRYGYGEVHSSAEIAQKVANSFPVYSIPFLSWADFEENYYKVMSRLGYPLIPASAAQKDAAKQLITENDPACRYRITENENVILVQIMTVN